MINTTFNSLTPSAFLAQAQSIVTAMTGNPAFPEPWPSTVPTLAQIQSDLTAFQNAVTATAAGDRTRIVERNGTRETLAVALADLGFYVQSVTKDEVTLASTGFPLRQHAPRPLDPEVPPAPERLRLERGTVSGTLVVRSGKVQSAGSYDLQTTSGDPTVEANWAAVASYKNCRRIELQGLTPGKTYTVRMRALGAAGPGAWATSQSIMAV